MKGSLLHATSSFLVVAVLGALWDADRTSRNVSLDYDELMGRAGARDPTRWRQDENRWLGVHYRASQSSMSRAQDSEQKKLSDLELLESAKHSQQEDTTKDMEEKNRDMLSARKLHEIHRQLVHESKLTLQGIKGADSNLLQEAMEEQKIENEEQTSSFARDFQAQRKKEAKTQNGADPTHAPSISNALKIVLGTNYDGSVMPTVPTSRKRKASGVLGKKDARNLVRFLTGSGAESPIEETKQRAKVAELRHEERGAREEARKKREWDKAHLAKRQEQKLVHFLEGSEASAPHSKSLKRQNQREIPAQENIGISVSDEKNLVGFLTQGDHDSTSRSNDFF